MDGRFVRAEQQTKAELLAGDTEISNDVALDYVIKKIAGLLRGGSRKDANLQALE